MPGDTTSGFVEPEHFEAALRADGCLRLLITGRGPFRARLTQVTLHQIRLSSAEEQASRVALIAVPPDVVQVVLPPLDRAALTWAGIPMQPGDLLTIGPGQRMHARTDGPCRWGALRLPVVVLAEYCHAMTAAALCTAPVLRCWRPRRTSERRLRSLYEIAIRTAGAHPGRLTDARAAHGLEQQIIEALIDCLQAGQPNVEHLAARRQRDIVLRFEEVLQAEHRVGLRVADVCAAIGVSQRRLRACCQMQLGMSPRRYMHFQRLQLVRRALRIGPADGSKVSGTARRYGFHHPGRFAASYRALYGELPHATLRRGTRHCMLRLALRKHARRFDDN